MLLDFLKVNCNIQNVQLDIQSVLSQLASIYARLLDSKNHRRLLHRTALGQQCDRRYSVRAGTSSVAKAHKK